MSYIPDVRQEFITTKDGKKQANPYFEGNLDEDSAKAVEFYDYAVNQVDNFFNNLDVFEDTLNGLIDLDNVDLKIVFNNNIDIEQLSDEESNQYSKDTMIVKAIRDSLLVWLELERDSLVTSMIESNS